MYIEHYRNGMYLRHSTKCVSCENQMRSMYGDDAAWMGNASKLFSAESDGVRQVGNISGGFLGKTLPYFEREQTCHS